MAAAGIGVLVIVGIVSAALVLAGGGDGGTSRTGPLPFDPLLPADDGGGSRGSAPPALRVEGNRLVGGDGRALRLVGVNRAGGEYACAQGFGVWDGAADPAFVDVMASWGINGVRLPLNEHCWLGINGVRPELGGAAYQQAVAELVAQLNRRGLVAVLDLHWSGPGTELALQNAPMPNADHSADFWRSVASAFAGDDLVVFDLFNEPHDVSWTCWRDGCPMPDGYQAVGMQTLVDAVRSTGATQPIVVSGIDYANDLSRWLEMAPTDPLDSLVAGFHLYNFTRCRDAACWEATVAPVAEVVPVVTTELGEDTCRSDFVVSYMTWADDRDISYLGWTFNAWSCRWGPSLIADESGTPTPFGAGFRQHVLDLSGGGDPDG